MPSTYLSIHCHLVFSTKDRTPRIEASWQNRLYQYLGGTVEGLKGLPQSRRNGRSCSPVGWPEGDRLRRRLHARAEEGFFSVGARRDRKKFFWLAGRVCGVYGERFSANGGENYIANQEEHHRRKTFREELVDLLEKAGVEYDVRYLD